LGGHETSCIASKYALAAKKQGKFWGVANMLFDKHPADEDAIIEEIKKSHLGLDIEQLKTDAKSKEIEEELQSEISKAYARRVIGTPAIEINGVIYMGSSPYDELKEKIELAEKRAAK